MEKIKSYFKQPKNIFYLSVILVSVIIMAALCVHFRNTIENTNLVAESKVKPKEKKPKPEKVVITVDVETLKEGLDNMGTLITQEYSFTQVETYTKEKSVLKFFTSSSEFTYSYDGTVTAGVDFEKIEVTSDEETKTIVVKIPKSQIESVNIDKDTFKIYSEKESLWNPIKMEDFNDSLAGFEDTAKERAVKRGILEKADEQAKSVISNFVSSFPNVEDYTVVYETIDNGGM